MNIELPEFKYKAEFVIKWRGCDSEWRCLEGVLARLWKLCHRQINFTALWI